MNTTLLWSRIAMIIGIFSLSYVVLLLFFGYTHFIISFLIIDGVALLILAICLYSDYDKEPSCPG